MGLLRLPGDGASRIARFLFTVLMALAWAGVAPVVSAAPDPAGQTPGDLLIRSLAALDALRRETPRDSFDPRAIVQQVGREPAKLFEWVRDNTWWVPYQGALRGPSGVLMDRIGNSLDRSLLLAEMLRLAGHQVRLARAPLDEATASRLAEQVRPYPGRSALPRHEQAADEARAQITRCAQRASYDVADALADFDRATLRQDRINEELMQRTAEQTAILATAMPAHPSDPAAQRAEAQTALRDHWWVQCQQKGAWVDLDVLLAKAQAGQANAQAKQTIPVTPQDGSVALPDDARHDLTVRVVIERWEKGKMQVAPAITTRLSALELATAPLTIMHVPPDWPKNVPMTGKADPKALKQALLAQHRWLPVLVVGKRQVVMQGFGDDGQLQTRSRFDGPADLGRGAGGLIGGGLGGLGGGEEPPEPTSLLTAEWIEFEIHTPGQATRTVRHEVFDLIGPAARLEKKTQKVQVGEAQHIQRALHMLGAIRALGISCKPTSDYLMCLFAEGVQGLRPAVQADGQIDLAKAQQVLNDTGVAHNPLFQWATLRWQACRNSDLAYLDRLNLVAQRMELSLSADGRLMAGDLVDVLANDVAVCPAAGDRAFALRMEQGVADTVTEDYCVRAPDPMGNTTGIVSVAAAQGRRPTLVRQPGEGDWNSLAPEVRARIQQDQAAGYAVVLASATGDGAATRRAGWWRVDEKTGQTVGAMDSGYHQGVELVVVLVCIAIGAGLAVGWCYLQVKFETFAKWTGGFDYTKDESKPAKSIKAGRPRIKDFVPPPPPPPEE